MGNATWLRFSFLEENTRTKESGGIYLARRARAGVGVGSIAATTPIAVTSPEEFFKLLGEGYRRGKQFLYNKCQLPADKWVRDPPVSGPLPSAEGRDPGPQKGQERMPRFEELNWREKYRKREPTGRHLPIRLIRFPSHLTCRRNHTYPPDLRSKMNERSDPPDRIHHAVVLPLVVTYARTALSVQSIGDARRSSTVHERTN
jgi:hypothetical protein